MTPLFASTDMRGPLSRAPRERLGREEKQLESFDQFALNSPCATLLRRDTGAPRCPEVNYAVQLAKRVMSYGITRVDVGLNVRRSLVSPWGMRIGVSGETWSGRNAASW